MEDDPKNPIQELLGLRDRMNRLFEESVGRFAGAQESAVGTWTPAVDIYEVGANLVLHVELPGVRREDVDLLMEDGTLIIEGERGSDPDLRPVDFHRLERAHGPFRRVFRLPPSVASGGIEAEMRDGILVVTLPRVTETGPKARIPIQGSGLEPESPSSETAPE